MEDRIYLNILYDYYGELLTDKQKEYFEAYYFNNFSLGEIGENYNVSRNAVHKQIKVIVDKLNEYESILNLNSKNQKLREIVLCIKEEKIRDEIIELM